jgi:hypothetical protein
MTPDKRQKLLAFVALGAVAIFAADKLVLTPLANGWKTRSDAIVELRKSIAQGRVTVEREPLTNRRWNEMRKNTLPLNASAAEQQLLGAFDKWSRDSRVSVSSVRPQWKRGASDDYSLLECRVDASGSLSALSRFLYEVEKSPLALKVEGVELAARDNTGQQLTLGLLVSGQRLAPLEAK